jgi:hypothetical protein
MTFSKTYLLSIFTILLSLLSHTVIYAQEVVDEKHFDTDFKERYDSSRYNYEGKNTVSNPSYSDGDYSTDYKNDNDPVTLKEEHNHSTSSSSSNGFSWFFIIALVAAVLYLIFILLNEGSGQWFHRHRNTSLKEYQTFNVETANPNDFKQLIHNAEKNNDYRLAIRYYYLLVLKSLSLKNIIDIEDDKTNVEYLNEISNNDLNRAFSKVLYVYNYTWYGEFSINTQQYHIARNNFQSLIKKIG